MVRTGLGGSIPGAPDSGGGSSDSSSGGGSGVDPADEFGRELGGDPAESGGSNTGAPADPADEFGQELGGDPAESGGNNTGAPAPSDGGPSGGSSSSSSLGEIRDRFDARVDSATDTISSAAEPVTSRIDAVSDALPGRTGEAFAAGVGVAAIPEPTPVTEVSGTTIAGGAALVGGGILASRALRDRAGELGVGDRVSNELDVGQPRRDVTEVGVGERVSGELGVGDVTPTETQIGIGSTVGRGEFEVNAGTAVDQGTNNGDLTDPFADQSPSINDATADKEFIRDDSPSQVTDRDPVRFPADEAATGTAPGALDQFRDELAGDPVESLESGVGAGGVGDPFSGGGFDPELAEPNDPTDIATTTGVDGAGVTPGDSGTVSGDATTTGGGTGSGTGVGAGTGTGAEPTLREAVTVGTQSGVTNATPATTATPGQVAEPTVAENVFAEPAGVETGFGPGTGSGSRDRVRNPDEEGEADDDRTPFTTLFSDEQFDSGIQGASDVAGEQFRL